MQQCAHLCCNRSQGDKVYVTERYIVCHNGYNGYNKGRPSARLFGWSAADWSWPAPRKSISSNIHSLVSRWERRTEDHKHGGCWLDAANKFGQPKNPFNKCSINRIIYLVSSQTRWSWQAWQIKGRVPRSGHAYSSSRGHWSHMLLLASLAAASNLKVCTRKQNLLTLRIMWLDRSRWKYRGTVVVCCKQIPGNFYLDEHNSRVLTQNLKVTKVPILKVKIQKLEWAKHTVKLQRGWMEAPNGGTFEMWIEYGGRDW